MRLKNLSAGEKGKIGCWCVTEEKLTVTTKQTNKMVKDVTVRSKVRPDEPPLKGHPRKPSSADHKDTVNRSKKRAPELNQVEAKLHLPPSPFQIQPVIRAGVEKEESLSQ